MHLKILASATPACHSERSAEDEWTARGKTKNLHAVELFSHGLVWKKRELYERNLWTVKASENPNIK